MSFAVLMQYKKAGEEAFKKGDFARAERFWKSALAEAGHYQPANEYTAERMKTLSIFYMTLGAFAKAEPYLTQTLEIEKDLYDPDNIALARSHNLLGFLYQLWGDLPKAETQYKQAIRIEQKAQFLRNPQMDPKLAHQSHHHLAMLCCAQGRHGEAFRMCNQTCAGMIKAMGPSGKNLAADLHSLAMSYCAHGLLAEAQRIYHWSMDLTAEQWQMEYLGSALRDVDRSYLQPDALFNPDYEWLGASDEVWRPSAVHRAQERHNGSDQTRWAQSGDRFSTSLEESWSPAQTLGIKRN